MTKIIYENIIDKKEFSGMKLIDMHNHSSYSDGNNSIGEIVSRAKELNIGVCITDHNEIKGSLEICKEILSIPSIELTSSNGYDLLAYFYSEKDAKEFFERNINNKIIKKGIIRTWKLNLEVIEFIEKLSDYNSFIALPHPFTHRPKNSYNYYSKKKNEEILKKIDAIEGVNGMLREGRNKSAIKWAESLKKPIIGGTDSHNVRCFGNILTGCFAETRTEFLEEIKRNKNYIIIRKRVGYFERAYENIHILNNNVRLFGK